MKKALVFNFLLFVVGSVIADPQIQATRRPPPFTAIESRVAANVVLLQDFERGKQTVELKGEADAIDGIDTEVRDGVLVIADKRSFSWRSWSVARKPVNIVVTADQIEGITVAGAGTVLAKDSLMMSDARFVVSGSGSLKAMIVANGRVRVAVSGSGTIDLEGLAPFLDANVSGSGNIRARTFLVDKSAVRISGSGDVEVNVMSELDAVISGSGNVYHKDGPVRVNSHVSGSGTIKTFY
jgi:hypothetical protein